MKYMILPVTRTILCYLSPAYNCILNIARKIKNHTYKIIYDFWWKHYDWLQEL